MGKVCVVTGGGSGMGLSAAKFMPKDRAFAGGMKMEDAMQKYKTLADAEASMSNSI